MREELSPKKPLSHILTQKLFIFLPKPIDFSAERCYTDPTSAREVFLLWREKPFRFPLSTCTKEPPSKQREVTFYLEVPIT